MTGFTTRGLLVKLLVLLIASSARAGDFDPPAPRLTLLKPQRLELAPGGEARLEMIGTNLELFRYGQVLLERRNVREFRVLLSDPSPDGTLRVLTVKAAPDTEPGLYELRLFTPRTSVAVPVPVRVR